MTGAALFLALEGALLDSSFAQGLVVKVVEQAAQGQPGFIRGEVGEMLTGELIKCWRGHSVFYQGS